MGRQFGDSVRAYAKLDPHLIMYLFLPALIFESAFSTDYHIFRRLLSQVVILAGAIYASNKTNFSFRAVVHDGSLTGRPWSDHCVCCHGPSRGSFFSENADGERRGLGRIQG